MVDRLVHQRLVERAEAPTDRRAKRVTLTRKGKRIVDDSLRARQDWLKRAEALLTEEQKSQVADALHTLADASVRAEGDAHTQSEYGARKPRTRAQAERKTKSEG
jgi:DNA-binding PadR family transcriptional regulator